MQLTLEGGTTFDDPAPEQIAGALRDLGVGGSGFAILAREEQVYIQASADERQKCVLEYRDGSEETHFRCADEQLPLEDVIAAFVAYARNDNSWRGAFDWKPLSMPLGVSAPGATGKARAGCASMIAMAITSLATLQAIFA